MSSHDTQLNQISRFQTFLTFKIFTFEKSKNVHIDNERLYFYGKIEMGLDRIPLSHTYFNFLC